MSPSVTQLDNPIWHSLTSRHARLAIGSGSVRRYPADVAPFVAVESAADGNSLDSLVEPGERVGIIGAIPQFRHGWQIFKEIDIYQYLWDQPIPEFEPEPEIIPLTSPHLPAMLELTALVYPAYFREGTARLGDYFGVVEQGHLCAMAGIRMAMNGFQELSAVCTHPDHRGKGLASRLSRHLISYIGRQGDVPFLHTESDNSTAQSVYERLGFELRAKMPFFVMDRI